MNKFLSLLIIIITLPILIFAQQKNIKCKMTINEILQVQKYNQDQQEYRDIKRLSEIILTELSLFYSEINSENLNKKTINKHITVINNALKTADDLEMNYSMFEKDIKYLKKYLKKNN